MARAPCSKFTPGANRQPQSIIVIQKNEGLEKIKKAANTFGAPLVMVICGDINKAWKRSYDGKIIVDIDASIITDHMMLQATELKLGSIWICSFKPDVIKNEFSLPNSIEPINILAIGYAEGEAASPNRHDTLRKPLEDIVHYEVY